MKIDILTLFPDMFAPLEHSIVGKAKDKGLLEINYHNFRENAEKARHVDDEPYGGGQGMLLRAQPIFDTFDKLDVTKPRVILLDPAGRTFDQAYAEAVSYTHLDVYKRQTIRLSWQLINWVKRKKRLSFKGRIIFFSRSCQRYNVKPFLVWSSLGAVSYTHLNSYLTNFQNMLIPPSCGTSL